MSKENNIRGVNKIEIGLPGDGVVGAVLTEFKAIVLNSLKLTGAKTTEKTLSTELVDAYLTVSEGSSPATSEFELLEVAGTDAVMLMGGSWDDPTKTWKAPLKAVDKYLSIVYTTEVVNGKRAKITFPYAKIIANHDGAITKGGLLAVRVALTANTPVTAAGVENPPYEIQFEVAE